MRAETLTKRWYEPEANRRSELTLKWPPPSILDIAATAATILMMKDPRRLIAFAVMATFAFGCSSADSSSLDTWYGHADDSLRRNAVSAPVSARVYHYLSVAAAAAYSSDGWVSLPSVQAEMRGAARRVKNPDVVFAVASSRLLSNLIPPQLDQLEFELLLDESLRQHCRKDCSSDILAGLAVARAVTFDADTDRYSVIPTWEDWNPQDGESWRVNGHPPSPPVEPYWGSLIPSILESGLGREDVRCRVPPPNADARKSAEEVERLMANASEDDMEAARFWDDPDGFTSGPAGHWVRITLQQTAGMDPSDRSAILRDVTSAIHDANIRVWDGKYEYLVQRPSAFGVNPLLNDPPHPEYPSAHAAVSAAAGVVLEAYGVGGFTDTALGRTRSFDSPSQAAFEAGMSRVTAGIHQMESFQVGRQVGVCVGEAVLGQR